MAVVLAVAGAGCSSRKSSLLMERQARGAMAEDREIARNLEWQLAPAEQTKAESGVEVSVTHASQKYLKDFFSNRAVFGAFAGKNPYFPEQLVFYVKVANKSDKVIGVDPLRMVLLDDRGNQYQIITADYVTALAESKAPVSTLSRGLLDDARPGYFGFSVPVGKILGKSQWRFALLKMSALQPGQLHPGVVYDGLVAFWSPHDRAKTLKLVVDVKTAYGPDDEPTAAGGVVFEMAAARGAK
jgi:hypothetical protein